MWRIATFSLIKLFCCFLLVAATFFIFGRFSYPKESSSPLIKEIRVQKLDQTSFKFIEPLLGCEVSQKKDIEEFAPLKFDLQTLVSSFLSQNKAKDISIYFDTRDGQWLGINEDKRYSPASLLKVPNMIAIYKIAESYPDILQQKFTYDGAQDANQGEYFKSFQPLLPHQTYTVGELVEKMIASSDNNAVSILLNNVLSSTQFREIYSDLGLTLPEGPAASSVDFMTVKDYASFFRILYNATYLNRNFSEKALSLLSKSDFKHGIRAGVQEPVMVTQKFGERYLADPQGNKYKELHDCGIVYFPDHPYLLCIMTKGSDFDTLASIIQEISRQTYNFVDTEFKKKQ